MVIMLPPEPEAWIRQRVMNLAAQVKLLLKNCDTHMQELQLIDVLQHLGVAYHFEKEINETLSEIDDDVGGNDGDRLRFLSLRFRLLRQHGYNVTSNVFCEFKDEQGNFKASLSNDAKGLLSLYEAAYLSFPGEQILDDAAKFTKKHLQSMENNLEPALAVQVSRALRCPLHRRIQRLETRNYFDIYQDDECIKNDLVLELAKLDFHLLQLLHRDEVKSICEWRKKLGLAEKLTFARDRVVECYFWILAVYFEPCYSRARLIATKVIVMFSLMDDIYDDYGTVEELRVYTEQIQRWDLEGIDQLDDLLRLQYLALYDTVEDFKNELAADQISNRVDYLKEAIKRNCKAWLKEVEWRDAQYVPSLEEYETAALQTSSYTSLSCAAFIGMDKIATNQVFDWILRYPKMVHAANRICRLLDDIVSHEFEQKRDHVASAVQCYMKEHGASLQKTCVRFREMVEDAWKEINQECLNELPAISMDILVRIINFARVTETFYEDHDSYTHSQTTMKDNITRLLVQPIGL